VVAESANEIGDCVITIGTGAFISVIIGDKPLSSNNGFYPLVSYKKKETTLYILHCGITSAGVAIEWAKSIGLFNDYKEFNQILNETADSKNVRFIAAFGYLDLEGINKSKVGTGFIGITSDTTKAHMLRAVIDSIVFSIKIKFELMLKDLQSNKIKLRSVR
jgi:glycerol kinase